ncbi:MAG: alpha/beta hydrolase [Solirubrobacteraceae bacterium]|jgi:pimeloyl-ACP methyl ester carboxylesterase
MADLAVRRDGVGLSGEQRGEGIPVVLAHGLTATRRYVVMGSRALERSGHRVVGYDARGHGRSSPAGRREEYDYVDLVADLEAVMAEARIDRAVLAGASMGAHTALRFALEHPERVLALAVITPAFDPARADDPAALGRWDALAAALRTGGVAGFMEAYGEPEVDERWRQTVLQALRQRLSEHEHPEAVADAMRVVPRARPFESFQQLGAIEAPTVVVASRDDADPGHPRAVGERCAAAIPRARLVGEAEGESPLAWQGGRLSSLISQIASQAARKGLVR